MSKPKEKHLLSEAICKDAEAKNTSPFPYNLPKEIREEVELVRDAWRESTVGSTLAGLSRSIIAHIKPLGYDAKVRSVSRWLNA